MRGARSVPTFWGMSHHEHAKNEDDLTKVRQLLKGLRFAMLTTEVPGGQLHSRPMSMLELDDEGGLWFLTSEETHKVQEVSQHHQVNVGLMDKDKDRYVSISGTAQVVHDRQKLEELWNPVFKAWFPDGLDSPGLTLLRVAVERVEYWNPSSSKAVQVFGFARALLTGRRAKGGEHGTLEPAHGPH